ncbi:MAG: hypothetical protein H7A50_11480 [Akkermansiaceae bacterium]|nr:hypothetical protein [Akkermansiaceae bacterium]
MNRSFRHLFALLACLATLGFGDETFRTFTNAEGKTIEGQVVRASRDSVIIKRRSDLRIFPIKTASLSEKDQAYVANWRVEHPDIQLGISTKKVIGKRTFKQGGGSKHKEREACFDISISNNGREPTPELALYYWQLVTMEGNHPSSARSSKDKLTLPTLAPGASTTLRTPVVKLVDQSVVTPRVVKGTNGPKVVTDVFKAEADLKGICIIVCLDGKEVASSNPSNLDKEMGDFRDSLKPHVPTTRRQVLPNRARR